MVYLRPSCNLGRLRKPANHGVNILLYPWRIVLLDNHVPSADVDFILQSDAY